MSKSSPLKPSSKRLIDKALAEHAANKHKNPFLIVEEPPETPPEPPPEAPKQPRTRATSPRPKKTPQNATPLAERNTEIQAQVAEAYALPYSPPTFTASPTADPMAELAQRELCRRRLLPFIHRFRPKYQAGWVHEDICRRLERFVRQVEAGKEPRLLLMMPPRAGKSEIGSRNFPAWVLGQHPEWEIIAASHTGSLTMSFSRYIRDLLRDPAYQAVFPDTKLDPASQSVENWNMTGGGGYLAAGVGTGITGRGCLTPYSRIDTPSGIIPIVDIKVGDLVYGYQHETQEVVVTRVTAVQVTQRSKPLVTNGLTTLTTDHRVYDVGSSSYSKIGESPRLSGLWRQEGSARCNVQGVSFSAASELQHYIEMFMLREELRAREGRASEVSGSSRGQGEKFLFSGLLRQIQGAASGVVQQGKRFLRSLREAADRLREEQVLQFRLLFCPPCGTSSDGVLRRGVFGAEVEGGEARREVPDVRHGVGEVRGTPHQSGRGRQSREQLDLLVRSVPPQISSTHGASAADLAGAFSEVDFVVDIQTGTGNFFTGRLLVHNCHILLLDDLVKDIEAADSPTIKENTWEWYVSTAYSRLAPGGGVLGIMTWWSEDDWAGRIQQVMKMDDGGDQFEIVRYPALNEEGDEYILADDTIVEIPPMSPVPDGARMTRPRDTALHPARYTTEALKRIKKNYIASGLKRMWQSLYQQNPTPDDGIYFTREMLRRYSHRPPRTTARIYQAWDFAITEEQQSDYTVCATILQDTNDDLYVLHVLRFKSDDSLAIVDHMIDQSVAWGTSVVGVEDGQIWKTMRAQYEKRCKERRHYTTYEVLTPLTDKMSRANPLRGRMQLGKVWFPTHGDWVEPCLRELMTFPAGKHDDQVDALAWAVRLTLINSAPRAPQPPKVKSWKDKLRTSSRGVSAMAA